MDDDAHRVAPAREQKLTQGFVARSGVVAGPELLLEYPQIVFRQGNHLIDKLIVLQFAGEIRLVG